MPIFTILHTPVPSATDQATARATLQTQGPRIVVQVGLPDVLAAQLALANRELPAPYVGHGLVDTGCSNTCIDATVAAGLGLQPINEIQVSTPAGTVSQLVYGVKLTFPGHGGLVIPFLAVAGAFAAQPRYLRTHRARLSRRQNSTL
jgi:hypothetical protein